MSGEQIRAIGGGPIGAILSAIIAGAVFSLAGQTLVTPDTYKNTA